MLAQGSSWVRPPLGLEMTFGSTGCPHERQNRSPAGIDAPQFWHGDDMLAAPERASVIVFVGVLASLKH
jgi:hypothetical protein